jgi:hypothetical protein
MKPATGISARRFVPERVLAILALLIFGFSGLANAEPPQGIGDTGPGLGDTGEGAAPAMPPRPSSHQHFFTGKHAQATVAPYTDLFVQSSWQEISLPATQPVGRDLNALVARLVHTTQQIVRDSAKKDLPDAQKAQVLATAQKQVLDLENATLRAPVSLSMQVIDVIKRDEPERPSVEGATDTPKYQKLLAAFEQDKEIYPQSCYVAIGKLDWQSPLSPSPQQQVQLDKLKTTLQNQLDAADAAHQDKIVHVTNNFAAKQQTLTNKLEHGSMTQSDYSQQLSDLQQEQTDEMNREQTHYNNARAKLKRTHDSAVKGVIGIVGLNRPYQVVYLFSGDPAVMNWHSGQHVASQGMIWKMGLYCYTTDGEARPFAPPEQPKKQPSAAETSDDDNASANDADSQADISAAYLGAEVLVKQVKRSAVDAASQPAPTIEPATEPVMDQPGQTGEPNTPPNTPPPNP